MRTVLVTGAEGFIGRNLLAHLERRAELSILRFDLGSDPGILRRAAEEADFVFHLAGVNRPKDPADFESGNRGLTEELVGLLAAGAKRPPILVSSSIQAALDNPYGKSKAGAEEAARAYALRAGTRAYLFRLPNVFGKWCRPNYNSVIATWCHNTARGLPIQINDPTTELDLVYVDEVCAAFIAAMEERLRPGEGGFCGVERRHRRSLGTIAATLEAFAQSRRSLVMPPLADEFTRELYATWLSYLPEGEFGYGLDMKRDERGWLAEFIKSPAFGQIFVSRTKPGVTRGNHWHHTKIEKFLVVSGTGLIRFRKIDGTEILEYPVDGDALRVVDIPPGYTHSITNIGEGDLLTLFWTDEIFDPARPDTYFLGV